MKFPKGIPVYGDTNFRGQCPVEREEHRTAIKVIRETWPESLGRLVLHPRNEGKRGYQQYVSEHLDGLTTGASDIIIPGDPCYVIEVKRRDHTKSCLSATELEYLKYAQKAGCRVAIALGWAGVIDAIEMK